MYCESTDQSMERMTLVLPRHSHTRLMHAAPSCTLYTSTTVSAPPTARNFPQGENRIDWIRRFRALMRYSSQNPLPVLKSATDPCRNPQAIHLPSGDQQSERAGPHSSPTLMLLLCTHVCVVLSHTRSIASSHTVAKREPSGSSATAHSSPYLCLAVRSPQWKAASRRGAVCVLRLTWYMLLVMHPMRSWSPRQSRLRTLFFALVFVSSLMLAIFTNDLSHTHA